MNKINITKYMDIFKGNFPNNVINDLFSCVFTTTVYR